MKFLKKLKSSNFWISMISAVVLILQAVFNVEIKTEYLSQIIMSILGLLVMSGIVTDVGSDENGNKKDIEEFKQDVTSMINQVNSKLETDIIAIAKQFKDYAQINTKQEVIAETQVDNIDKSNEVINRATTSINETAIEITPIEVQTNIETTIENQNM